jgi:hypothetical protein
MLFGGRPLRAQTAFRGLFAVCPHNKKPANRSRRAAAYLFADSLRSFYDSLSLSRLFVPSLRDRPDRCE